MKYLIETFKFVGLFILAVVAVTIVLLLCKYLFSLPFIAPILTYIKVASVIVVGFVVLLLLGVLL